MRIAEICKENSFNRYIKVDGANQGTGRPIVRARDKVYKRLASLW